MVLEALQMALKSLKAHKMRAFLTMLGIIIGVVSLVVLVSVAFGTQKQIISSVNSMGTNSLLVTISDDKGNPVSLSDLDALVKESSSIHAIAPTSSGSGRAYRISVLDQNDSESVSVSLTGTMGAYEEVYGLSLLNGSFFRQTDVENHTYTAVISSDLATELFDTIRCTGEEIRIDGISFTVTGVYDSGNKTGGFANFKEYQIYLPYTTLARISSEAESSVTSFGAGAVSDEMIETAQTELGNWLNERLSYDTDAYTIQNQSDLAETTADIKNTLAILLGGIAAISLFVGGIGIMNIMLVSVTERTNEIGIRKAIGATKESILLQFLIEAVLTSLIGCLIGIAASWLILTFFGIFTGSFYALSVKVAWLAVAFSCAIGVAFGLYPAARAAAKHPIDALRYHG